MEHIYDLLHYKYFDLFGFYLGGKEWTDRLVSAELKINELRANLSTEEITAQCLRH